MNSVLFVTDPLTGLHAEIDATIGLLTSKQLAPHGPLRDIGALGHLCRRPRHRCHRDRDHLTVGSEDLDADRQDRPAEGGTGRGEGA
jgi:hypothetical protein